MRQGNAKVSAQKSQDSSARGRTSSVAYLTLRYMQRKEEKAREQGLRTGLFPTERPHSSKKQTAASSGFTCRGAGVERSENMQCSKTRPGKVKQMLVICEKNSV